MPNRERKRNRQRDECERESNVYRRRRERNTKERERKNRLSFNTQPLLPPPPLIEGSYWRKMTGPRGLQPLFKRSRHEADELIQIGVRKVISTFAAGDHGDDAQLSLHLLRYLRLPEGLAQRFEIVVRSFKPSACIIVSARKPRGRRRRTYLASARPPRPRWKSPSARHTSGTRAAIGGSPPPPRRTVPHLGRT